MPISAMRLKHLMPHGGVRRVATKLDISESTVSSVFTGKARPKTDEGRETVRRIQTALAEEIGMEREDVFPLRSTSAATRAEATPLSASASAVGPRARAG